MSDTGSGYKVASTDDIKAMNETAATLGRNRVLAPFMLKQLDPDGWHVCTLSILHEHQAGQPTEPHLRTMWLLKMKGGTAPMGAQLDVEADAFDRLMTAKELFGLADGLKKAEAKAE